MHVLHYFEQGLHMMLAGRRNFTVLNQKSKCGNWATFNAVIFSIMFENTVKKCFALSKTWLGITYMQLLKKLFPLPNQGTVLPINLVRILNKGIPEKRIEVL